MFRCTGSAVSEPAVVPADGVHSQAQLAELLTEQRGQLSSAQEEYFSKAIAEAESRSLDLVLMGVGKMDYATLFGITMADASEIQV